MTFSYSKEFSASSFTDVENAFIYEYLPEASGNAVKVYLYGLFLCQNEAFDQPLAEIAKTLNMTENEITDCFKFWEEFGLCSVLSTEPFAVVYMPVKNNGSNKPRKYKAEKYTEFTKGLQALLPSRMISTNEYSEYFSIMENFGIKPEAMLMIVKYCADRKGNDIGYKYISKVAKDFGARGIVTVEKVEKELSSYVLRTSEIERILKALKLRRAPDIDDLTLLKKWTAELDFEVDNIVFAASKMKKGSFNKLDEFLMELYSMKSFSKEEIADYMSKKEKLFDLAIAINRALSVYVEVLDAEIDNYVKKWVQYDFSKETLLFIANHAFKSGKNTLQYMDELVETLHEKGFIDLSSVGDYFDSIGKNDEFIKKILLTCGVNRRPTEWDRKNLAEWRSWNFSDEMILEAAKLASGKGSPIPYIQGVLSNWKNNSVFSLSSDATTTQNGVSSQEDYNREYARRRAKALQVAQNNVDKAMQIEGFGAIYSRINSIEKDLAFAEINDNETALAAFEKEKKETIEKANTILKNIGLTLNDLYPRYACEKCKDTGYVGTHRCDCFGLKV